MSTFEYISQGKIHRDTSREYMINLGMNTEAIESVLTQQQFELSQNVDLRKTAYARESDPLYMEWQFDNVSESEQIWRDKVAEIKTRYPLPE